MDTEIQAEIIKVRKLSRFLRAACTYLTVMVCLGIVLLLLLLLLNTSNMSYMFGAFKVAKGQMTPLIVAWAFLLLAAVLIALFSGLTNLRALFANFSEGRIYTSDNVRHIRHLGRLALLYAVWQLLQPLIDVALLLTGVFDRSMTIPGATAMQLLDGRFSLGALTGVSALPPFIMAGLVILAAWIMEVGRRTSEAADDMRHEVELLV